MSRVRWAPSNTGPDVHVGNVRTILYNYLFAKKIAATTVFRIEDSDLARSKPEYSDAIANTLDWLGLRADEGYKIGGDFGPYTQQEKLERYKIVADELIEKGFAYRCYCTQDELNALRASLPEKERTSFRYPGICRDRKDYPNDKDYVVRFKAPRDGSIEWDDIVFGKISVPNKENFDWVLMRSNGVPLYNFGCAVDDFDQQITHIVRGRDHIINTNIQILLHRALGSPEMKFCHLPMMLGPDGTKLSKRHASVSISDYRKAGYTKGGILNYLVRFGWGFGNQEIFSMEELVEKFDLNNCGKNDGRFDVKKFAAIQYEHLKTPSLTATEEYAAGVMPFLANDITANKTQVEAVIHLVRHKCKTYIEVADELDPILRKEIVIDQAAKEKFITEDTKIKLKGLHDVLGLIEHNNWNGIAISNTIKNWLAESNFSIKDIGQPARVAITGRTNSPDLFLVMAAIGKATTLYRLNKQL